MSEREYTQHLSVKVEGVVMPGWLAALAGTIFLCSVLSLLVILLVTGPNLTRLTSEIRVLQLDDGDVQTAIIRAGLAHRSDFAHPPKEEVPPK